jgi:hypothetical protein
MEPSSVHIMEDTGAECLCGCVAAIAVYPSELHEYSRDVICPTCKKRLEQKLLPILKRNQAH